MSQFSASLVPEHKKERVKSLALVLVHPLCSYSFRWLVSCRFGMLLTLTINSHAVSC